MPISYARLQNAVVVEIIEIADSHTFEECYHPDFVAQCIQIPEGVNVEVRSTHDESGFHAPVPVVAPKPTTMSPLVFQSRFHSDELGAIAQAAMSNPQVFLYMLQMASAQEIDIADARTIGGVHALSSAGLLTAERASEILTA